MAEAKKTMLKARLHKRLKALNFVTFEEYCAYLFSAAGMERELVPMIDLVTTNKTDFFRESDHFDYLINTVLPELLDHSGAGIEERLLVWSSACSSGEEPYTLAMVLNEFGWTRRGYDYSVLATDISTRMIEAGKKAVYEEEQAAPIPAELKKKYLLRSKDRARQLVKIAPLIRSRVEFRRVNLMDDHYDIKEAVHIIFCRNVIIYFDRQTQERLITRLCRYLRSGGYLFMGHSENLHGMNLPLIQAGPTVYRKIA
jgi:chemotaxis protein methyltransferase CheR